MSQLVNDPKVGASWEGFVIDQVLATQNHDEAFFWATHQGAEIDLVLRVGSMRFMAITKLIRASPGSLGAFLHPPSCLQPATAVLD